MSHRQDLYMSIGVMKDSLVFFFVYYESIKWELNKRLIFDSRCDARLNAKAEGCTRLAYTYGAALHSYNPEILFFFSFFFLLLLANLRSKAPAGGRKEGTCKRKRRTPNKLCSEAATINAAS